MRKIKEATNIRMEPCDVTVIVLDETICVLLWANAIGKGLIFFLFQLYINSGVDWAILLWCSNQN